MVLPDNARIELRARISVLCSLFEIKATEKNMGTQLHIQTSINNESIDFNKLAYSELNLNRMKR